MDKLFRAHVKAFLLSQQISDAPDRNLEKIRLIANSNPSGWDGKLPATGVRVDEGFCKLAEATPSRPVVPWWWYAKEKEPVPDVVKDIYRQEGRSRIRQRRSPRRLWLLFSRRDPIRTRSFRSMLEFQIWLP